jgi:hypothetical protein
MSPLHHKDDDSSDGRKHGRLPSGLVIERRGLATTRRGRQALASGTRGQILDQVYARHP